jgi:predicted nucleotidyltransferase
MDNTLELLKSALQNMPDLELAVLVGSRATDTARDQSDWDIAIRWKKQLDALARLEQSERLKQKITACSGIHPDRIDLIDMTAARLAMRALIAEEGLILKVDDTLAWFHYLSQTWAELEDYYWRKQNAA